MSLDGPGDPLTFIRTRLKELLGLTDAVHLDLDGDLLSPDGYSVGDQPVDSLALVDLITSLEDTYGVSVQDLIDRSDSLNLRSVVAFLDADRAPSPPAA
jgi:hypothetical protein